MTEIMHSIYDMMGKYTYPHMKESAPKEHVDSFFQVKLTNDQIGEPHISNTELTVSQKIDWNWCVKHAR